jgi:hypothetical protein
MVTPATGSSFSSIILPDKVAVFFWLKDARVDRRRKITIVILIK